MRGREGEEREEREDRANGMGRRERRDRAMGVVRRRRDLSPRDTASLARLLRRAGFLACLC